MTATTLVQDIFERAAELKRDGKPFVLATVVWSKSPTSARPGAKGIITPDGALFGWVGGSCSQPSVIRQALNCLESGESRVLLLDPDAEAENQREGRIMTPMTCHSGGSVEVFLEPYLPPLQLVVAGESPVADSLIQLGHTMGYRTVAVRPDATETTPQVASLALDSLDLQPVMAGHQSAVIIATMGMYDEDVVRAALDAGAEYVAIVASRRRFAAMQEMLIETGVDTERLKLVKAPAGLDIHASTPEEIAISILAEVIAHKAAIPRMESSDEPFTPQIAVDPVCGMAVEIVSARQTAEYNGTTYYFCCPGCKGRFLKRPEKFIAA